jgi:peptidoglycan-associated lipoprotein
VSSSASSLALQAGGGMDLGLKRHVSLRLLQVDWLRTQLPNGGTNVQNHFRISTGVELHF